MNSVLARHPSVSSAVAAWRAAVARYPQAVSLADPMLDTMMAPGSLGSPHVDQFAWVLQGRQTIPWRGKRQLRGNVVQHEARAAMDQVGDARLQLAQITKQAYYEYYLAHRQLELNSANRLALSTFRANALDRYEANLVTQQDVLQADVELADLERQQIEFDRLERVATARINTLLLRYPATPLPPPPARLGAPVEPPDPNELLGIAQASRPDLAAAVSKLRAEQASVSLAQREFKPDVELVGRYDTFWQGASGRPLQGQIGLNMNVPVQVERRRAAVREAAARTSQQRAEVEQLSAQIQYEVQVAYERIRQAYREVEVFEKRLIPAANSNVNAAQAAYITGKLDFLRLVEAQRERIELLNEQAVAVAAYYVGLAELERVVGGVLPTAPRGTRSARQ
ncbi:MAG: TolC family protein [Pirellulales bacterium]